MAGVDITGPGAGLALQKDIYVNTSLVGPFDATSDVEVFLEDTGGNPITPVSSVLVGNDLTITANIPVPSGVALKFPDGDQYPSYRNGDVGWRVQNAWFYYSPPAYPAKFAKLKNTTGAEYWYTLETPLTVNGVTSTERFVDASGVQGWPTLNNLNLSVIDKLTGLMFTRTINNVNRNWNQSIDDALAYSVTINGNTYSDWYLISNYEVLQIFGRNVFVPNWQDPTTLQTIVQFNNAATFFTADTINQPFNDFAQGVFLQTGRDMNFNSNAKTATVNSQFFVHDVRNLIS
jgi:hypothetical protein